MTEVRGIILDAHLDDERGIYLERLGATPGHVYGAAVGSVCPSGIDFTFDAIAPEAGCSGPLPQGDVLFITGSALHAWQDSTSLRRQVEIVQAAVTAGMPVFGSCWGLQLLAVALGGQVTRAARPEGMVARGIRPTTAGRGSALLVGKPEVFDAFAVHGDEVTALPRGAVVLAENDRCAVQAVHFAGCPAPTFGVQYHPEYDTVEASVLLDAYADELLDDGLYPDRQAIEINLAAIRAPTLAPDLRETARHRRDLANMLVVVARHRS